MNRSLEKKVSVCGGRGAEEVCYSETLKRGLYDIIQLVSNLKKGGYAKLKKMELIATSKQSCETTHGDYETAKSMCLQFYNSGVYTYLNKKYRATRRE